MMGEKNLLVAKTEHFDIIFPKRCQKIATILWENAELILDDIFAQYEINSDELNVHIPVSISPSGEVLNAFFSPFPYNRIVLFDTSDSSISELEVFSQTFLSIFKHELTHAITFNMKNQQWQKMSNIFGDIFTPGMVLVSPGTAEGATVSMESSKGEGRLNNEYSKHLVKQAKIEGKFPKFDDIQGGQDIYPSGSFYYFNGAFHDWLQKKFGMKKYSDFWFSTISMKKSEIRFVFKEIYGIQLKEAWTQFENEYFVPKVQENNQFLFKDEKSNGMFKTLSKCENGFIFSKDSFVYFVSNEDLENPKIQPKKLFSIKGLNSAKISNDGNFIAINYFCEQNVNIKSKVKIFNTKTRSFFTVKENGLKNSTIIQKNEEYFLVSQKYVSPNCQIKIQKINFSTENKISSVDDFVTLEQEFNVFPSEFTQFCNGNFVFIEKKQLNFNICIMNINGELLARFEIPEKSFVANSLSVDKNDIYLSFTKSGTMPRLAKFSLLPVQQNLNSEFGLNVAAKITFFNQDFSGGIFNPIFVNGKFIYIAHFYKTNKMLILDDVFCDENYGLNEMLGLNLTLSLNSVQKSLNETFNFYDDLKIKMETRKFNPFDFYKNGLFLPISIYQTKYFSKSIENQALDLFSVGATYITSNPWTQMPEFIATTSYNYFSSSFGTSVNFLGGTATEIFKYNINLQTEVDFSGWKQSYAFFDLSSKIPLFLNSSIMFKNQLSYGIGKENQIFNFDDKTKNSLQNFKLLDFYEILKPQTQDIYSQFIEFFQISFSTVKNYGSNRYSKGGFSFSLGTGFLSLNELNNSLFNRKQFIFSSGFLVNFPKLLPISCENGILYNFPLSLKINYFPVDYYFENSKNNLLDICVFDFMAQTVLFSYEVQKAIPFLTFFYVQNIFFDFGYFSSIDVLQEFAKNDIFEFLNTAQYLNGLKENTTFYSDKIYFDCGLKFAANYGAISGRLNFDLKLRFSYNLNQIEKQKNRFDFGVLFSIN